MGKTETIHDWGSSDCGCLSVGVGVDGGNSADFCDGAGDGWSLDLVDLGVPAYVGLQAKSCTIALAVLTIYVVDFAINAGWCSARTEQADITADAKTQSSLRAEVSLSILYRLQSSNSVLLGVRLASPNRRVQSC